MLSFSDPIFLSRNSAAIRSKWNKRFRYVKSIDNLRKTIAFTSKTPQTPDTMNYLTAAKANNIEQILLDLDELMNNIPFTYIHCGTIASGQGGVFL